MKKIITSLCSAIEELNRPEGESNSGIAYGTLHCYRDDTVIASSTQDTFAYLIINGAVRITQQSGVVEYSSGQYFLSSSIKGVAAHAIAIATPSPHLALRFDFTVEDVVAVLLDMEVNFTSSVLEKSASLEVGSQDQLSFLELALRIVNLAKSGGVNAFLEKHLKREMVYNIVTGPYGSSFVQDILRIRNARDIYSTNDWIRSNYKSVFAVDELAEQLNMSVTSFHRKFKAAIGMGPLQCQKQLRLVEARRLMLDEDFNVTDVALEVGYESLSQFSREYRKMFGLPPQKDIRSIRSKGTDNKS
ncbi:helix-turn-helix domain-containing protein [Noviherbaspirillum sedimenti]|uniref:Helix-turn-helix domain-containing protein n=1 Tax=Noviherbaspirillum sedimenti TaxID=2320865 RepID=A0A3A3FZS0_9BURK|nr:helix-turn-helix domain-containing protein [Noviherbaspirillum sedimenti]RJG00885.1 helix-turn-helix domain-containing protein [Noviherbaspirillum sedimenti]